MEAPMRNDILGIYLIGSCLFLLVSYIIKNW